MKWFRFYHEAYRNPKVQDMRPELFKFWVNVLCVASESETRGTIPSEAHLRLALGLTKPTTRRFTSELEALSLLHRSEQGALLLHDWHQLQPESDDSAKRQRDKRSRDYVKDRPQLSRDTSRDVPVTSCDSRAPAAPAFLEGEREGEGESPQPPLVKPPEDPIAAKCVEVARERWGDKNGDSVIGDLLRDYEPSWVRVAIDKEWDKHRHDLRPAYLRSILQGFRKEGGPPAERDAPAPARPVERKYTQATPEMIHPKHRRPA